MSNAYPLPSPKKAPSGAVTTAGNLAAYQPAPLNERHVMALEARGFDIELLVRLGVGASTRLSGDAITIPFFDGETVVGVKHRTVTKEKAFTQDKGSRQILYNINALRDEAWDVLPLIITEGELDCWAALMAGRDRVVSVPNGAPSQALEDSAGKKYSYIDDYFPLFKGVKKIILATDDDEPGRALMHDLARRLGPERCWRVKYPKGCKDLADVLTAHGAVAVRETLANIAPMEIPGYYEIDELPPMDTPPAFDIGMPCLDRHYKMRQGDLTVVTGVPGHGKSSFINEVCCRMALKYGWRTVFASFEQNPQTDHRRALRTFFHEKLEVNMTQPQKEEADKWIRRHFGFIVPSLNDRVSLEWVLRTARSAVIRKEAQIVVVDPWNEMDHDRPDGMTLTEYTGDAIKRFKQFAKRNNVHVIVAAHPAKMSRGKDGKFPIPGLYDIADSAHWANKPDVGVVIYRDNLLNNETLIRIVKARYAMIGVPGQLTGHWNVATTRYVITDDGSGEMDR